MLFEELVSTSARVAESSSRLAKVALLADLLRRLGPHEIDAAVAFLAGETRQGRLGVGPAAVWNGTLPAPSSAAALHLVDVDEAFERISRTSGLVRTPAVGDLACRPRGDGCHPSGRASGGETTEGTDLTLRESKKIPRRAPPAGMDSEALAGPRIDRFLESQTPLVARLGGNPGQL